METDQSKQGMQQQDYTPDLQPHSQPHKDQCHIGYNNNTTYDKVIRIYKTILAIIIKVLQTEKLF